MSFADGWAAINLEMPPRVPRTEYSAHGHWPLICAVTGRRVDEHSDEASKLAAQQAFLKAWKYDFMWSTLLHAQAFGDLRTRMGHAEYAVGGSDKSGDVSCPFTDPDQVLAFDPAEAYGPVDVAQWTRRFNEHYDANVARHGDVVNMTGIYTTLVSGLIEIFGWEMLLMAAGIDLEGFGQVADRYANWALPFFEALAASKAPVVMVHDDIVWTEGAIFRPDWYRKFVFPNHRKLLSPLRDAGKKIAFTSDGNYSEFIDDIVAAGVHGLVMEPMTDIAAVAERYGKTHFFIGNVDTRVLLSGTRQQIRDEVERCLAVGKSCPGFFLAVGNHIPANTPVESAMYYNEVYEELSRR